MLPIGDTDGSVGLAIVAPDMSHGEVVVEGKSEEKSVSQSSLRP